MDISQWKNQLLPYEYAVEELKIKFKNLRKEMIQRQEYSPIEFVTGRIKKISSILDKAERLNIQLEEIDEKIEDIAGIRIMCQFEEDIYAVVNHLRVRKDMQVLYEKDYVNHAKKSGYRSYHVIIQYPVQVMKGTTKILAEIQIRTLAMNFWATIEHSLKYKYQNDLPEDLQNRLIRAADAAFQLDKEMSEIREEIVRAQVLFEMKSVTVKDIIASISEMRELGREDKAIEYQSKFNQVKTLLELNQMIEFRKSLDETLFEIKKSTQQIKSE